MTSFPFLAPLAHVLPDTPTQLHNAAAVPAVTPVAPASAGRRVADGLPEEMNVGVNAAAKPTGPVKPTDREQAALDEINQALALASIGLQFEFDKESEQMIARVVDISTGELIRQMPSEEMLQVARTLDKLQGLIFQRAA